MSPRARTIEGLLGALEALGGRAIAHVRRLPAVPPEHARPKSPLPEPLERVLAARGLRLYTHQVEALEALRAGANVMLVTPTASGKTLAFNLAVLERLYHDPEATALYIYPLKALTQDQLSVLKRLEAETGIELGAAVYDGDTPQHLRPRIRERARIVLTNPHALHQYLPWHHKWRRFFKNLTFVVLDEAHAYRGVFGSNVALLLRRFRRLVERYGARPQFVLASATLANPAEHGRALTGLDFRVIARSGAPQGERVFVFWDSARLDESPHRQASALLAQGVRAGFQTLCFAYSRKLAELIALWAKEQLPPSQRGLVTAYRAGYLPEERREIERQLRDGELRGVAATTALELGIDVGELDVVIIAGYPGTVISTWQMAGRAGRRGRPALVVLLGFENPLDQYFMRHPDAFFERPHEHAIVDLENPYIVAGHAMCAAAELPLQPERDRRYFGPGLPRALAALAREGLIERTPAGYVYRGPARPTDVVSLESLSERAVRVLDEDGELLETLELRRAYDEAHPGAVLLHRGETYVVEALDLEQGVARVAKRDVEHYTDALHTVELGVRRVFHREKAPWGGTLGLAEVDVVERFFAYRVRRYDKTLGLYELNLPPLEFETVALVLTLPEALRERVEEEGLDWAGGLHAAEHALIAMTPFHALCDRWDLGGLSTPHHPDTGAASIFIYDGHPGGIGIAEKALQLFDGLARTTRELVRDCPCEAGCPSCIYSPKCGNNNEPLDKRAALLILNALTSNSDGGKDEG